MIYSIFQMIDGDTPLAGLFNTVMQKMNHIRGLCAPTSFRKNKDIASFQDKKFCDFCRYETWMHAVVERLVYWRDTTEAYITEFESSWKYYAASQRLEYVREYGDDGNTVEEEKAYEQFSVIHDLRGDDFMDIVRDTVPDDIKALCNDLVALSHIDLLGGLRKFVKVEPYRMDEDGNMHRMSQEDCDMTFAMDKVRAEDRAKEIMAVAGAVSIMYRMLGGLRYDEDNKEELRLFHDLAVAMLRLDYDIMGDSLRTLEEWGWEKDRHDEEDIHHGEHTR